MTRFKSVPYVRSICRVRGCAGIACGVRGRQGQDMRPILLVLSLFFCAPSGLVASTVETSAGRMTIAPVVSDLRKPWGLALLPGGGFLVTEIGGRLWSFSPDGARRAVSGVPEVVAQGQGGLLDVMVPADFARSRLVFLTFAKRQDRGAGTALARGVLSPDGTALLDVQIIFEMADGGPAGRHFGSRVIEAPDGTLFLTIGDRGRAEAAQDVTTHNGKVLRLTRDGRVPSDNPFATTPNARPEIWSYGHRNPQGAAVDPRGQLWVVEHGAKGGDEVNSVQSGRNYGWPVISFGTFYDGSKIGIGTEAPGMEQPAFYWDPSIAPAGMAALSDALPAWAGHLVIGSLKFDYLSILDPRDWGEERIKTRETKRVRDVEQGPDGAIWFLSEDRGTLYRMTPVR